ncbi:cyclic nucleotide-binding domain-containing protein [Streptomyces malaysiensis]|uniref:Cyclic nucleotide-binding domain-containing protein n=1 Tax=Streptomyces malaysiensis subsp. samsunensis TaxID=459658 RepID=A0A9X2M555_STRMQ|nr:cyclic nucleotide-binding domain-containing protein [Streptomyces samsunensis]MCQ8835223.1 cyclic nucleotide-binding domain-containing protein [Streptomyces samsunensis]
MRFPRDAGRGDSSYHTPASVHFGTAELVREQRAAGELAVLDDQPRTATVIAAETCQVRIVPAAEFLDFVGEHGLLAPLLRHAIARVRESEAVRLELATSSVPAMNEPATTNAPAAPPDADPAPAGQPAAGVPPRPEQPPAVPADTAPAQPWQGPPLPPFPPPGPGEDGRRGALRRWLKRARRRA